MSGTDREESRMGHSRTAPTTRDWRWLTIARGASDARRPVPDRPSRRPSTTRQTFVLDDYCDVSGLSVEIARVVDIARAHQPARAGSPGVLPPARYVDRGAHESWPTASSLTSVARVIEKDMRVMEQQRRHRDGPDPGNRQRNALRHEREGNRQGPGAGSARAASSTSSGAELSRRVVRESTGRSDDFCTAAVAALS